MRELYEEHSVVLVSREHPLACRRKVDLEELASHPWVLPSIDTPLRPKLNRMLSVHRSGPPAAGRDVQTDSPSLAFSLVRHAGLAWAVASRHAIWYARHDELRVLECTPHLLSGPICAFTLRGGPLRNPTRVLIDCLADLARQTPT